MNRQLQANGGIMNVSPREKFGLGSKLKKFVRKIIPNEVAEVAVRAAPFVAPFNPALAAAMGGLGTFDQTGRIGESLKQGALTYGLGQGARFLGGAGLQGNPFEAPLFSSPLGNVSGFKLGNPVEGVDGLEQSTFFEDATVDALPGDIITTVDKTTVSNDPGFLKNLFDGISNQNYEKVGKTILDGSKKFGKAMFTNKDGSIDKAAVLGAAAFATSYAEARALANQAGVDITEEEYDEATKADKQAEYASYLTNFFGGKKEGGRIGYAEGTESSDMKFLNELMNDLDGKYDEDEKDFYYKSIVPQLIRSGEMTYEDGMKLLNELVPEMRAVGGRIGFEQGTAPSGIFTLGDYARFLETAGDFNKTYDKGEDVVAEAGEFVKSVGDKEYGDLTKEELLKEKEIEDKLETLEKLFMKNMDKYDDEYGIEGRDIPDPDAMGAYARELIRDLDRRDKKLNALAEIAGLKDGGRIGLKRGTDPEEAEIGIMTIDVEAGDDEDMEDMDDMLMAYSDAVFTRDEKSRLFRALGDPKIRQTNSSFKNLHKILKNPGMFPDDELILKGFLKMGKAKGGRIKYASGANRVSELLILRDEKIAKGEDVTDIEAEIFQLTGKEFKSVGGISNVPTGKIRKNSAGIKERDYRDEGGFVPVGIKEKADDVPAMLSKNEFVITADAVRGIGGGDVEKGSKKLYNLMKNAEQVGKA
tara:strand:- start:24621 stop:26720 length:2100 start_codon:yes stop_codon:yes gene_type:complete